MMNTYLFILLVLFRFLLDNVQNTIFKGFFVSKEPVLFPCVVYTLGVISVSSHAPVKHRVDKLVIRILLELKGSTVLHELFELRGLTFAELI